MDLAKELEDRYERNEQAFEQGRIAEKWYLKNAMFFQAVARQIEANRELELRAVDLEGEAFIKSLIRELATYDLVLTLTAHGEARISKESPEHRIIRTLHEKKDWVHEFLLTYSLPDQSEAVLSRLAGINAIAQKTEHNGNYYKLNG